MSPDLDRIAGTLNSLWDTYGYVLILAVGATGVLLCVYGIRRVIRAQQRARIISALTAVIVLAWTSEGLWEVAYIKLALPLGFAVVTFFVFEAMMLSSAVRAEEHRRQYGTPGAHGAYVWVLASATATVVTLNAASVVEGVLRFLLPLLAAGLWWVDITAPRQSDTPEVKSKRRELERQRQATWAVTPRDLLVWAKLMRPGEQTTTEAERERRIRRMVVCADRVYTAPGSWAARRAERRLRRLARLAQASDVAEVRERATRTAKIVDLVLPDVAGQNEADVTGPAAASSADSTGRKTAASDRSDHDPAASRPAGSGRGGGQMAAARSRSDRSRKPAQAGHKRPPRGQKRVEMAAGVLAEEPDINGLELGARFGLKEREGRRLRNAAEKHLTDLGRPIAAGQLPDSGAASSNGHSDAGPAEVADMTAESDRS